MVVVRIVVRPSSRNEMGKVVQACKVDSCLQTVFVGFTFDLLEQLVWDHVLFEALEYLNAHAR